MRMKSSCARSAGAMPFQNEPKRAEPVDRPADAGGEAGGIAAQDVEEERDDAEQEQVEEREAPDEAPERDAAAQRRVLGEERLVGAEQARPRDEAVGEDVERAARGRERRPGGEERVQLRHADAVAVGQPDGRDRAQGDDVRDAVEGAPLQREPDAGAARDEAAAVHRLARAAATTAPAAFVRCVLGVCSAGVFSCSIGCSIGKGVARKATPGSVAVRPGLNSSAVLSLACTCDVNAGLSVR